MQLGHYPGELCPHPQRAKADSFTVIHLDGIHDIALDFCGCVAEKPAIEQLLRSRLYPATVSHPATAATFQALDHFQMLSYESKLSVHEYFNGILRQTDNTGMKALPVNISNLLLSCH
jgi:hypothetical protein